MGKISDEMRKEAHDLGGYIETLVDAKELDALADRIDNEVVAGMEEDGTEND